MVRTCCVEGCKAPWRPDVDLSFFSFPMRNGDLLKEWLQVVPTNNRISKYSRICSNHFEESQYECISGKRFLKKNAVPTIFPHDVAKFKEIIEEVEKLSSTSQHVILQNMIDNNSNDFHDHYNTQEQETFSTYVSLPLVSVTSNVMDEAVQATPQTRNVSTQTLPRPTEKEKELRHQIKNLQSKLRRKELRILTLSRLLKHLK